MEEQLHLTQEWGKTFPQNSSVEHRKVTFHNRYGIILAADFYRPKGAAGPLPALAVCGPFGAVKEQASGLYAQEMARRGFLTILTRWSPSSASTWSETGSDTLKRDRPCRPVPFALQPRRCQVMVHSASPVLSSTPASQTAKPSRS